MSNEITYSINSHTNEAKLPTYLCPFFPCTSVTPAPPQQLHNIAALWMSPNVGQEPGLGLKQTTQEPAFGVGKSEFTSMLDKRSTWDTFPPLLPWAWVGAPAQLPIEKYLDISCCWDLHPSFRLSWNRTICSKLRGWGRKIWHGTCRKNNSVSSVPRDFWQQQWAMDQIGN